MEPIKVHFNEEVINTYRPISVTELVKAFQCKRAGAHLKVRLGTNVRDLWPDEDGNFLIPPKASVVRLVAFEDRNIFNDDLDDDKEQKNKKSKVRSIVDDDDDDKEYKTKKSKGRRGNSSLPSFSGDRAVPGFKRKEALLKCPLPSKSAKQSTRSIEMCELVEKKEMENEKIVYRLKPIFEIPITISEMNDLNVRTIYKEIRRQVGGDQYVLLNKRGNPIRDMPNTRGLQYWDSKTSELKKL
ncbi:uncharacterized protein [Clytia hemisphaerica]|uniref:uncharacterized protein n=1 Tax=Clytia hemisphaerica TaxID=252671 RepID=UPI0034D61FE3